MVSFFVYITMYNYKQNDMNEILKLTLNFLMKLSIIALMIGSTNVIDTNPLGSLAGFAISMLLIDAYTYLNNKTFKDIDNGKYNN